MRWFRTQPHDLGALLVGEPKAHKDTGSHFRTHALMAIERVVVSLFRKGAGSRLGDIVQKSSDPQGRLGLARVKARHHVTPHVEGVPLVLRTAHPLHGCRCDNLKDGCSAHRLERDARPLGAHRLLPLVAHPFGAHAAERVERPARAHGLLGLRIDGELKGGREAGCTQHAKAVLREPIFGLSYRTNQSRLEVTSPIERVDELSVNGIHGHRVDGEVAAGKVRNDVR